jgi:hypothetical protein
MNTANNRSTAARMAGSLFAGVLLTTSTLAVSQPARAASDQAIQASHIKFVYPDSPETSNAPFPPEVNQHKVDGQLRTVVVHWHGRDMALGQYLRALHMKTSDVVTIRVYNGTAAVYTYR